eukprot:CAMPEP_0202876166 /NCGR_PEP_ID=MMETSP1391-20130828/28572_1 /ASSEMBLY_ACC=CAM_ASM_000867 /TAXON_ID=1034604 /ORGANISM="Chlamydomonas leiostraca, Strain SAG 11-49" /LENGTH=33 /DNA_ID= /DNA_START= /DNA_END= /DNA_ORIENTATION=
MSAAPIWYMEAIPSTTLTHLTGTCWLTAWSSAC